MKNIFLHNIFLKTPQQLLLKKLLFCSYALFYIVPKGSSIYDVHKMTNILTPVHPHHPQKWIIDLLFKKFKPLPPPFTLLPCGRHKCMVPKHKAFTGSNPEISLFFPERVNETKYSRMDHVEGKFVEDSL